MFYKEYFSRTCCGCSTKSEYCTLATIATELVWLQSLLHDLGIFILIPPTLWCHNIGATYLTTNIAFNARPKHVKISFHFVSDKITSKTLAVLFISNKYNLPDIFTKPAVSSHFSNMCAKLHIICLTSCL
jgi:hypothetical protein